jgi:hypothetical protein
MKYFLRALAIIVSFALLFFGALRSLPIHVYDGFESPRLNRMVKKLKRGAAGTTSLLTIRGSEWLLRYLLATDIQSLGQRLV